MKILLYGETPLNETGAARVDRHLLDTIVEYGIEVEVLGTSHFFEDTYDHDRYPYKITPVDGATQLETHQNAGRLIDERAGTFDVLFISGDMHVPNILMEQVKKYPSIVLAAIDGVVRHVDQVQSLQYAQWPIVYSEYSYNQVLNHLPDIQDKFRCIQLGCEPDVFYPLPEEDRRAYRKKAFGITDDERFLVMFANRNQIRKDPARAMKAFHLFHERVPNSILYMHCRMQDVGGNLASQAKLLGLQVSGSNPEVLFTGPDYTEIAGYSREVQNKMYNAADVGISTAQGEGWGLTTTEFMAAGTPFIGPANTTFFELLGKQIGYGGTPGQPGKFGNRERGYLAKCGGDDLWSIYYGVDDASRPLTSAIDMAEKLYHVYTHREEAKAKAALARYWTIQHTWYDMKNKYKSLLHQVCSQYNKELVNAN